MAASSTASSPLLSPTSETVSISPPPLETPPLPTPQTAGAVDDLFVTHHQRVRFGSTDGADESDEKGKGNPLQFLDIYPLADAVSPPSPIAGTSLVETPDPLWIVFIHGGAWRDPLISTGIAMPLFRRLHHLYGPLNFASLSYRLSPHPDFPHGVDADGVVVREPNSRVTAHKCGARHPEHLEDCLEGMRVLKRDFGMGRFLMLGHSCGATLAFQVLERMQKVKGEGGLPRAEECLMVFGIEGIYNLRGLIREHGEGYRGFIESAFGPENNGKAWNEASPGVIGIGGWKGLVVLGQSDEDELIGWRQVEGMKKRCEETKGAEGGVRVVKLVGGHDAVLEEEGGVGRVVGVVGRYGKEVGGWE